MFPSSCEWTAKIDRSRTVAPRFPGQFSFRIRGAECETPLLPEAPFGSPRIRWPGALNETRAIREGALAPLRPNDGDHLSHRTSAHSPRLGRPCPARLPTLGARRYRGRKAPPRRRGSSVGPEASAGAACLRSDSDRRHRPSEWQVRARIRGGLRAAHDRNRSRRRRHPARDPGAQCGDVPRARRFRSHCCEPGARCSEGGAMGLGAGAVSIGGAGSRPGSSGGATGLPSDAGSGDGGDDSSEGACGS